MNREQKRNCFRAARGSPDALFCRTCGHKTFFYADKDPNDIDHYDICCVVCRSDKTRLRLTPEQVDKSGMLLAHTIDIQQRRKVES
jgi:hypothetical protein